MTKSEVTFVVAAGLAGVAVGYLVQPTLNSVSTAGSAAGDAAAGTAKGLEYVAVGTGASVAALVIARIAAVLFLL